MARAHDPSPNPPAPSLEPSAAPLPVAGFAPAFGEPRDLLQVSDLTVRFFTYDGVLKALDGVNFSIREREIFGIVGETGCGKSVTAKAVLRLIPDPPGRITHGQVLFGGINLLDNIEEEARIRILANGRAKIHRKRRIAKRMEALMRTIRGNEISMIFQEPSAALNPVLTVEDQIGETFLSHQLTEICTGIERTQETSWAQARYFARLEEREGAFDEFRKTFGALSAHRALLKAAEAAGDTSAATSERAAMEDIDRQLRRLTIRARKNDFLLDFWKWLWVFAAPLGAVRGAIGGAAAAGAGVTPAEQQNIFLGGIIISTLLWLVGGAVAGRILSRVRKRQLERPIRLEVRRRVIEILKAVNIADPEKKAEAYPFELSGGMQQRVMIAMALACQPRLLLADEPTTALDVTIQAQILTLIRELREKFGSSIMLITHDLGVVAETCDRVGVMYAGVMAEIGTAGQIFNEPKHPYTVGLLRSIPESFVRTGKLAIIPGSVPSLLRPPEGCRFHPRCPFAADICTTQVPALAEVGPAHRVACHLYDHPESFPAPTVRQRDEGLDAVWEQVVKA